MSDSEFKRSLPTATYRFQLTAGSEKNPPVRFEDVEKQIPYLKKLGISHVYLSPIMEANPGSAGYGALDYNHISEELGGEKDFKKMSVALHKAGIGVIVDIVPNHMAATPDNPCFRDVMKHGKESEYAPMFDIRWDEANGKINFPTLGNSRTELIRKRSPEDRNLSLVINTNTQEIELKYWGMAGLQYWENRFPLDEKTIARYKGHGESDADFVKRINESQNGTQLMNLLRAQHYNLDQWQDGYNSLNYRRFFNINGLIGIRQEDQGVFDATHQKLGQLMRDGAIDGLRIDHIDGLLKPTDYLRKLDTLIQKSVGKEARKNFYVAAEKILAPGEYLPRQWMEEGLLHGTTGYDYLIASGKLLTDDKKEQLEKAYAKYLGQESAPSPEAIIRASRLRVMEDELGPEKERIYRKLTAALSQVFPQTDENKIANAFDELMAAYPVYRFYPENGRYSEQEQNIINKMFADIKQKHPEFDEEYKKLEILYNFRVSKEQLPAVTDFVDSLQHFTSPMVAKGTEDTAFYRYHLLRGANDVGAELGHISMTPSEFMQFISSRESTAMNVSSTHDTKLGENARLRALALSYAPEKWEALATAWKENYKNNCPHPTGHYLLHPNDQYLLLQTIVATYPLPLLFPDQAAQEKAPPNTMREDYIQRIQGFAMKALREGKERSDYVPPAHDKQYEQSVKEFIRWVVEDKNFLEKPLQSGQSPLGFMQSLAHISANVSLENIMLKVGAPGIPDIFQGSEEWLHTTVDPDNRNTPDFKRLNASLDEALKTDIDELSKSWPDGRIKQAVIARLLTESSKHPDIFRDGTPVPMKVYSGGTENTQALAFARISKEHPDQAAIVYIPRLMEQDLYKTDSLGIKKEMTDKEITIEIPESLKNLHFADALRGNEALVKGGRLKFTEQMRRVPGAIWTTKLENAQQTSQEAQR